LSRIIVAFGIVVSLFSVLGCRRPDATPLPTYPLTDDASAVRAIADRAKSIRTTSGTCGLTLTRPDGQSVALDGIMLTAPPDKLRLQATKFNQKLFDLTLNDGGLFVRVDDPSRKDKLIPASANAGRFVREWSLFTGGLFEAPDLTMAGRGQTMTVARKLSDGRRVECDVDRPTLTPRAYRMFDPDGVRRFRLTIPEYRIVGGIVYPDRMVAESEQGTIEIQMRDVELNIELPEAAFVPPARAEKLP
jgi:outer membrane lipoprotein-sorting protein